jgi:predicted nuclease of predicted toxin-antitoxin system
MDVRITSWLNSHGHEATHLRDQGLQRLPNGAIFDKGIAESRVIVTFDLDFGEIVALSKGRKTGVVLFRLRNTRVSFVIQRLSEVIAECSDALARGRCCDRRRDSSPSQRISIDIPVFNQLSRIAQNAPTRVRREYEIVKPLS